MNLDVSSVFENPGEVFEKELRGSFKSVTFQGHKYEFPDGAYVKLSYFGDEDSGITVMGSFEADTTVYCDRCLNEFEYKVSFSFTENYKDSPDDTQYELMEKSIELNKMLTDNLIASLPTKFLCDEQCKGLCSKCGKNLNEGKCDCDDKPDESNPFYGLKDLIDN